MQKVNWDLPWGLQLKVHFTFSSLKKAFIKFPRWTFNLLFSSSPSSVIGIIDFHQQAWLNQASFTKEIYDINAVFEKEFIVKGWGTG